MSQIIWKYIRNNAIWFSLYEMQQTVGQYFVTVEKTKPVRTFHSSRWSVVRSCFQWNVQKGESRGVFGLSSAVMNTFFRVADSNFTWWLNNVFRSFAFNTCAAFATWTAHRSKIKSTHTYHIILLASTTHTKTKMPLKLHFTVKILFFPTPFATLCKENKNVVSFLRDTHTKVLAKANSLGVKFIGPLLFQFTMLLLFTYFFLQHSFMSFRRRIKATATELNTGFFVDLKMFSSTAVSLQVS